LLDYYSSRENQAITELLTANL